MSMLLILDLSTRLFLDLCTWLILDVNNQEFKVFHCIPNNANIILSHISYLILSIFHMNFQDECDVDPANHFRCTINGICILRQLVCNMEYDCGKGDHSDEDQCEKGIL